MEAGKEFLRPPHSRPATDAMSRATPLMVPIRSLGANHRERIAAHLMALDDRDRYLRFGYLANDEQIQRYVDGLNFDRDEIFGIYNRRLELLAMADHPSSLFDDDEADELTPLPTPSSFAPLRAPAFDAAIADARGDDFAAPDLPCA